MAYQKTTPFTFIIRGFLFLLPLLIVILLVEKALDILRPITQSLSDSLAIDSLFGTATITILGAAIFLVICYLFGKFLKLGSRFSWMEKLENSILLLMPGYQKLRVRLMDHVPYEKNKWQAILLQAEGGYKIGFITNRQGDLLSLFIPDAPAMESGQLIWVDKNTVNYSPITVKQAASAMHRFGQESTVFEEIKKNLVDKNQQSHLASEV